METKQCHKCNKIIAITNFSKHSGTKDKLDNRCKDCVKKIKLNSKEKEAREYKIYPLDLSNKDWQVGKPTGTILTRQDPKSKSFRYEVRVPTGNAKLVSKSFAFDSYMSPDDAKEEANRWLINYSKENKLIRNMIKILDENIIEVQLTKDKTMKTDIKFSHLCQKYILCSTKSGNKNSEYYAALSINNSLIFFHKYITGYEMTDHINRDPLDNRLINLKETSHKLNNNNRGPDKKYKNYSDHMLGVRFIQKDESWQAFIKQNDKLYSKTYSVKKYGYEEAKNKAIQTRKEFNEQFNCSNS